ncbi:hypothetical protein [Sporomusa sphaeroides]|uniref:Uncharacterized protein n=1 Tax=Sporomusa sphaeroides DSM 2875 TaxID=1337886 RepID=A0ABP2C6H9_9FIRM|nr:hypothetical protein [Sporomusa sphaeroides]OLS56162.1 hypothetical protein SPSPH_25510 [Sporomusa sphaeroides DSM 2875]CVK19196.1 hypothetical protein SSPH_01845 [Sporomusa sphaeroides DSM 2875]
MIIELMSDKKNRPVAFVSLDDKEYHIPLKHIVAIHMFNQILRSLDTGIDIKFESYKQYEQLLNDVSEAVQKKKATAS